MPALAFMVSEITLKAYCARLQRLRFYGFLPDLLLRRMVIMVNAELRIIHIRCAFDITGRTKKCCRILDCAECDDVIVVDPPRVGISIHALHAECDIFTFLCIFIMLHHFNPRTPCGVRHCQPGIELATWGFQSTHSMRSATPP